MSDLFDQLKSAGPIKKTTQSSVKHTASSNNAKHAKTIEKFNKSHKSTSIRRESMPSPSAAIMLKKTKSHKARSLSPPKYGNAVIKSLKVKLERKKFEEFLTRPLEEHANNIRVKQEKFKDAKQPKKITPTKAQQKLFEPVRQKKTKAQIFKEFNIKPCKVRIHRDNLQQLLKDFRNKNLKKDAKSKVIKRPSSTYLTGSPPSKKGKISSTGLKNTKSKNSFFIKLNTSPSSKLEKKFKNISRSSPSSVAHHNKMRNSQTTTTTPTKFSRSQLIRSFGKRFFNVQVKIERCRHPLLLTFESNNRARRLQSKRNKSKNLSVSFREQVEIFGGSSESDDSYDGDFCAMPNHNGRKSSSSSYSISVPLTPVVMPARLKKVENGKVVDDIELDPSLFVDPKSLVSSTPFSPGRKKRDHKSFSPLKDESSPSPRKEQLKLANERIPPTGLRRLNIDEDDDEDDDCEYIVPIEMPQRRTSRTSSNATLDGVASTSGPIAESNFNFSSIFKDNIDLSSDTNYVDNGINLTEDLNKIDSQKEKEKSVSPSLNLANGSNDSFQSAKDNAIDMDYLTNVQQKTDDNQFPALQFQSQSQSSLTQLQMNANKQCENNYNSQINGACDVVTEDNFNESSKQLNTLNTLNTMDDISMNLFLEDSQTNEDDNHTKSFVDSIINETIDKLTKDIDDSARDKQFADTT